MKKVKVLLYVCLVFILSNCSNDSNDSDQEMEETMLPVARTAIPDVAFERALIELNIDDVEDGSVVTEDIAMVTSLVMNDKGISDLTGLEDFPMLENLWVNDNLLTSLDVSQNPLLKFVFAENNLLTNLSVTNLTILEKLQVSNNQITQVNLSDSSLLQLLGLANNSLTSVDISLIPNGIQLNTFSIENNPLTCIRVNAEVLNDIPSQWTKDAEDTYALDCI
ncbi:MAG: hypothetical protein HKN52_02795 [Eudoraea sp.]|nr:hypothetical protein [Eudoraea sp.]